MINSQHSLDRHLTSNVQSLNKKIWIATVSDAMRRRIAAIPQSLILHKTMRYFVKNCNEHTNKQALLQLCVLYAWAMKFNRKYVETVGPIARQNGGGVCPWTHGLWGMDATSWRPSIGSSHWISDPTCEFLASGMSAFPRAWLTRCVLSIHGHSYNFLFTSHKLSLSIN